MCTWCCLLNADLFSVILMWPWRKALRLASVDLFAFALHMWGLKEHRPKTLRSSGLQLSFCSWLACDPQLPIPFICTWFSSSSRWGIAKVSLHCIIYESKVEVTAPPMFHLHCSFELTKCQPTSVPLAMFLQMPPSQRTLSGRFRRGLDSYRDNHKPWANLDFHFISQETLCIW